MAAAAKAPGGGGDTMMGTSRPPASLLGLPPHAPPPNQPYSSLMTVFEKQPARPRPQPGSGRLGCLRTYLAAAAMLALQLQLKNNKRHKPRCYTVVSGEQCQPPRQKLLGLLLRCLLSPFHCFLLFFFFFLAAAGKPAAHGTQ